MPTDEYDAPSLAIPYEDDPPEQTRRVASPTFNRRSISTSRPRSLAQLGNQSWRARITRSAVKMNKQFMDTYFSLALWQRVLLSIAGVVILVLTILFVIYNESIFSWLEPYAKRWREMPGGWMILFAMVLVVGFPPLIGYSTILTMSGFVFGFPGGWFVMAPATIIGSTISFVVSRSVLKTWVHRMVAHDSRFAALSLVLKHDGLKLLFMIRLCPLPYSLSNGAISTIPTVNWVNFMIATALASPKLLIHVFVGAKLGEIAEHGGEMDAKTKAISYVSVVIGALAGVLTGWIIYRQTKARARQLEAEEADNARGESADDLERQYSDDPNALAAADLLREADDISLRTADADEEDGVYRDAFDDSDLEADGAREIDDPNDVFKGEDDGAAGLPPPI